MSDFRFRAAAALDLRQKQETDAATVLAQAEAELRAAEARVEQAEADRQTAQEQQVVAERRGSDIATLLWHQNWIVRLGAAVDAEKRDVDLRTAVVHQAEQRWRLARQRRLALERMRDRALRRHKHEEQRQELKVIDELARLRFVYADARSGDSDV